MRNFPSSRGRRGMGIKRAFLALSHALLFNKKEVFL